MRELEKEILDSKECEKERVFRKREEFLYEKRESNKAS